MLHTIKKSEISRFIKFLAFVSSGRISETICESWGSKIDKMITKRPNVFEEKTMLLLEQQTKECLLFQMVPQLDRNP